MHGPSLVTLRVRLAIRPRRGEVSARRRTLRIDDALHAVSDPTAQGLATRKVRVGRASHRQASRWEGNRSFRRHAKSPDLRLGKPDPHGSTTRTALLACTHAAMLADSMTPHQILGVASDASQAEIKRAYRKLAFKTHPDRNPEDPTAEARFKTVVNAWEQLQTEEGRRASLHGPSQDFLDEVSEAMIRAQVWIERVLLPHYAQYWRGVGAEAATRFVRDLDSLSDTSQSFEEAGWLARRRARRFTKVALYIDGRPTPGLSALHHGKDGFSIELTPHGLWRAGFGDSNEISDAVMRILLHRYAQMVSYRRLVPPWGDSESAWDNALAAAIEVDNSANRRFKVSAGMVLGTALLVLLMLVGAAMGL
jgi:hypothetical protein